MEYANIGLFRDCPHCKGNRSGYVNLIKTKTKEVEYHCENCDKNFDLTFENAGYIEGEHKNAPFWYWLTFDGRYTTKCCICRCYIDSDFPTDINEGSELPKIDPDVGDVTCCRTSDDMAEFESETGLCEELCPDCMFSYITDDYHYSDYDNSITEEVWDIISDSDKWEDSIRSELSHMEEKLDISTDDFSIDDIPILKSEVGYSVCFKCGYSFDENLRVLFDFKEEKITLLIDNNSELYLLDKTTKFDISKLGNNHYLTEIL